MSERYDEDKELRRQVEKKRQSPGPNVGAKVHRVADSRRNDEPRPVEEVRAERGTRSESGEGHDGQHDRRRGEDDGQGAESSAGKGGTSWLSVVFGWLAALGAGLILSGIAGAVVGATLGAGGESSSATENGIAGLVGLLLTLLLAFIVGGYVAGRMASRSGLKHGLLVPVLALVFTVILAGIGALFGLSFVENLDGVTSPNAPAGAPQNLGTIFTAAGILALLAPFVGGAIGGAWGARTGSRRPWAAGPGEQRG
jgi:amino acid transporter